MGFHKESSNGEEACARLSEENGGPVPCLLMSQSVGQFSSDLLIVGWQSPHMKSHLVFCGVYNKMHP